MSTRSERRWQGLGIRVNVLKQKWHKANSDSNAWLLDAKLTTKTEQWEKDSVLFGAHHH